MENTNKNLEIHIYIHSRSEKTQQFVNSERIDYGGQTRSYLNFLQKYFI